MHFLCNVKKNICAIFHAWGEKDFHLMFFEYSQLLPKFSRLYKRVFFKHSLENLNIQIYQRHPFSRTFFPKTTFSNLTIPMTSQLHFTPILPRHPLLNWPCFANYISFFYFIFFPLETPLFYYSFFVLIAFDVLIPSFSPFWHRPVQSGAANVSFESDCKRSQRGLLKEEGGRGRQCVYGNERVGGECTN